MAQERLNLLTFLSLESDLASKLEFSDLMKDFAAKKIQKSSRLYKVPFKLMLMRLIYMSAIKLLLNVFGIVGYGILLW